MYLAIKNSIARTFEPNSLPFSRIRLISASEALRDVCKEVAQKRHEAESASPFNLEELREIGKDFKSLFPATPIQTTFAEPDLTVLEKASAILDEYRVPVLKASDVLQYCKQGDLAFFNYVSWKIGTLAKQHQGLWSILLPDKLEACIPHEATAIMVSLRNIAEAMGASFQVEFLVRTTAEASDDGYYDHQQVEAFMVWRYGSDVSDVLFLRHMDFVPWRKNRKYWMR